MTLAEFQQHVVEALRTGGSASTSGQREDAAVNALRRVPGFAVYRNTVVKGAIDALQANYPTVLRLVGEPWFRAAAAVFVQGHPPAEPALVGYGDAFAGFLRGFPPAADLPYLADVARLDRCWTEAHVAPDAAPLDPAILARLSGPALGCVSLEPHPSARWAWFDDAPAPTIWRRNRRGGSDDPYGEGEVADGGAARRSDGTPADPAAIAWRSEGLLLVRPHDHVRSVPLERAACLLLDQCAAGASLADAALAALHADPQADLETTMAALLRAGAFARLRP